MPKNVVLDVEQVKRPLPAYIIFSKKKRKEAVRIDPEAKITSLEMKEMWEQTSEEEKEWYSTLAAMDKKRWISERKGYDPFNPPMTRVRRLKSRLAREVRPPRHTSTTLSIYTASVKKEIKEANPSMSSKEIVKEAALRWSLLTDDEKEVFNEKQREDQKRHKKEKKEYNRVKEIIKTKGVIVDTDDEDD